MELKVKIKKKLHHFMLEADFEISSSMALLGESGSGKSMTLKCIAGIETPDEGEIVLNGRTLFDSEKRINLPPQKRNVGYLFQNYALFPNMTVRENIAVPPKSNPEKTNSLVEEFYLTDIADKYPNEVSGGQQQRCALARIIASEPELILLDEPFSAIDSHMRWNLERTAAEAIERFGGISIMVTHDIGEAYRNCGKICVIDKGKTDAVVSNDEFISKPCTVAMAKISGCKNIYELEKTDNNRIFIPDLNIYFIMSEIEDGKRYVGLRSEDFLFDSNKNKIGCTVEKISDDINSKIFTARPVGAYKTIIVTANKDNKITVGDKIDLYIEEDRILLLK